MLILKCDQTSNFESLAHDAGISNTSNSETLIQPLIDQGFLLNKGGQLTLSEKGEEAIAKIWNVHELVERIAFEGIPDSNKHSLMSLAKF